MGRGRAKAKQTKVARQLKYSTTGTDLDRLRAELSGSEAEAAAPTTPDEVADDVDEDDPYAAYAADEDDDDEDAQHRTG
jgi:hypothetical protein